MKSLAASRFSLATTLVAAAFGLAAACDSGGDTPNPPNPPFPPFPQPGFCEPSSSGALTLQPIVTDLNAPVYVTAPLADERLYVVERGGKIRVWDDGQVATTPFIDVSGDIATSDEEQGLLSLAFHPDFAANGRAFIFYTRTDRALVVEEYLANSDGTSATAQGILIEAEHSGATNHNGGTVAFGPDGLLYISMGEGPDNAQDEQTQLGKILRIDVDGAAPYAIPEGNPWAGTNTGAEEMYAWGLRNPWRFGFDPANGNLLIGDVGQGDFEEINLVTPAAPGLNFGWPLVEGDLCRSPGNCDGDFTAPLHMYNRTQTSQCSVIGGSVYRGNCLTDLQGRYFFGDYCTGEINSFTISGNATSGLTSHTSALDPDGDLLGTLVSFGSDGFGELYVVSIAGTIYRVARP
ncbi:MAG: PQQ-dependent sugar dehydrogenase [Myxococcales bacterium]|nr:PQQ-dependent sugar dehydrogenase [Myxococcales bacterium]